MNDRHPSGTVTPPAPSPDASSAPYASYDPQSTQHGDYTGYGYDGQGGYDPYATSSFDTDPLFGDMPGSHVGGYDAYGAQQHGMATGAYDTGSYATGSYAMGGYDTGSYDTTGAWASTGYQPLSEIPAQPTAGPDVSGQWDASAWNHPEQYGGPEQTSQWQTQAQLHAQAQTQTFDAGLLEARTFETQTFEAQHFEAQHFETQTFDTGAYDATAWNSEASHDGVDTGEDSFIEAEFAQGAPDAYADPDLAEAAADAEDDFRNSDYPDAGLAESELPEFEPARDARGSDRPAGPRSRRRSPVKRSALLTVAVPSVCVMGVAGIAAASVSNLGGDGDKETTAAAPDPTAVKPSVANNKLDTQLENLSADAGDFADRASRTQERIDLKARQEAERKRAAEEAARKERLRPKFVLPVTQKGLSAFFGQAGINWMSVHTGIDFPVSYGTPVMAATDGTVRTQWNSAYGNMAIVTAQDGTETWYCHLSHYKLASGTAVKAGDVIAYSGNSGNSTGPHLHFEVRPGGGSAVDPLPWLRSHGLDPT